MRKFVLILFVIFMLTGIVSRQVSAEDNPYSLALSGQFVPFISGDAGIGDDVPAYGDIFDMGMGLSMEIIYSLSPRLSILGGIGYENHSGDSYEGISFDDLKIVPVYLGCKYYMASNKTGWRPYVRSDVGMARFNSVDVSHLELNGAYWDSSWVFMFDAGAGCEYRFGNMAVFAELKGRYMGSPSSSSVMNEYSKADSSWSMPLTFGLIFHF